MPVSRSDLVPLLELQRVDDAIAKLDARLRALPEDAAVKAAEDERAEVLPIHQDREAEIARLQREQGRLEDEISTLRTKLQRDRDRLASGSVTSPREIVNVQAEIDGIERRISKLEDDELEIMELAEAVGVTLDTVRAQLAQVDSRLEEATAARAQASETFTAERARLAEERSALAPTVLPEVLERYEQLRTRLGGIVVARFEQGRCGGCGLPLSPLAREEYRTSGEVWYPCENCRRILVEA